MELTPEFEQIIKETAQFIEKWEYNQNRIDLKKMVDSKSPGVFFKGCEAGNIFRELLIAKNALEKKGSYTANLMPYRYGIENKYGEIILPPPKQSFNKPGQLKAFFDDVFSLKPYLIELKGDHLERTYKILLACHIFYSVLVKYIKIIETEALQRIDFIYSHTCYRAGILINQIAMTGIREKDRTAKTHDKTGKKSAKKKQRAIEIFHTFDPEDRKALYDYPYKVAARIRSQHEL